MHLLVQLCRKNNENVQNLKLHIPNNIIENKSNQEQQKIREGKQY